MNWSSARYFMYSALNTIFSKFSLDAVGADFHADLWKGYPHSTKFYFDSHKVSLISGHLLNVINLLFSFD